MAVRRDQLAVEELAPASGLFKSSNTGDRIISQWFAEGPTAPSLQQTYSIDAGAPSRKLLLMALATRFPTSRKTFLRDAKALDFNRDMWSFPLQRILRATK